MQDGTLLKENIKGRNSNFLFTPKCLNFLLSLVFYLHLHVYLIKDYVCYGILKRELRDYTKLT